MGHPVVENGGEMKAAALWMLRGYKRWISPAFPVSCRYVPTCSEYAMEAVERYGALRGGWMAASRLLRCHPFSKGGLDPVVRDRPVGVGVLRLRDCFALRSGHSAQDDN
jgi:putative membrane protein insertion efficiency factor